MSTEMNRNYNCKDEELPIVCRFTTSSLKGDLNDFTTYSPKFNEKYLSAFEDKIATVTELVEPKSETKVLKTITERLYSNMESLVSPINHLGGYIEMANGTLLLSPSDFGLTDLRKGIVKKDAESVLKNLHTVNTNIAKYKDILSPQGLSEPLIEKFKAAYDVIADDKQLKYTMVSNRRLIVQENLSLLNDLYDQHAEILKIGKIIYKKNNAAKFKQYSFRELMKQVRKTTKSKEQTPAQ